MKVSRARPNVYELTVTSAELSALIAAARITADAMEADPDAPQDALAMLRRLLGDYDRSVSRLHETGGREMRPPGDSPETTEPA